MLSTEYISGRARLAYAVFKKTLEDRRFEAAALFFEIYRFWARREKVSRMLDEISSERRVNNG